MNVKLVSFADAGNIQKERVVFRATEDTDIGNYMVLCSQSDELGTASSGANTAYWFPDVAVKKEDLIVLYTKSGTDRKKDVTGGHTAYFYYWGSPEPIWNTTTATLVLLETNDYTVESSMQVIEPDSDSEV
jgi:hypothetical protein